MFSTRRRERFFLSWPKRQSSRAVGLGASSFIRRTTGRARRRYRHGLSRRGPLHQPPVHTIPPDRVACAGWLLPDFRDGTWGRRPPGRSPRQGIHATLSSRRLARPPRRCRPRHLPDDARIGRTLRLPRYHAQACRPASRAFPASMRSAWSAGSTSRANPSPLSPQPITVAAASPRTILAGPQWTA